MTRSPAASAASATSRPNPVEQPVINQTRPCVSFVISTPFNVVFTKVNGGCGTQKLSNTYYLSWL
jgi:hypothetical protein